MELSIIGGLFEQLSDAARAEVIDFARFLADKEEKQRKNEELFLTRELPEKTD